MRLISIIRLRLRSLFSRNSVEQELEDELRYHQERALEEKAGAGWRARYIEDIQQRKEECRDMRGLNLIDNLVKDTRFAIRQLRKNPGFTSTAIIMLALGMCASVAIFAFVNAALIQPLPYQHPERLVGVFEKIRTAPQTNLSYLDYLDWKKLNKVFSSLDVYTQNGFLLNTPSGNEPVRGAQVSDGFFRTLGVAPILGRDFYPGEDAPGLQRTTLLSYATWQKRFGGKRDVLGQVMTLDDTPVIVIGVLPQDFHFAPAGPAEFWTEVEGAGYCERRRSCHNLYGVARLMNGVSIPAALSNVASIARQLEKQYPDTNRDQGAAVAALTEVIVGNIRPILLVLLAGAGLLLLIASVNVASLLLVRAESRRREIAVRSSLGASPARIIGQFVTEGLVLVAAGTTLGLVSAHWAMQILSRLIPAAMLARMPFFSNLGVHGRVWGFAGVISLLAALLFSLTPAVHLSLSRMREGLTEGSRGSAGNTWRRLGSKLVVVELATAVVLLVGAGLLGKSLYLLLRVDLGLRPDHLVTMQIGAPDSNYGKAQQALVLERQIVSRIKSLAGVESVGVSHSGLPLGGNGNTSWFRVLGRPWHGEHNEAPQRDVSAGYFTALGAKLVRGRYFTEADDSSKPRVVIINQALAMQFFAGEDPIGKQLSYLTTRPEPLEIVGIVQDVREGPLDVPIPPVLYVPFNQRATNDFAVVVRTSQSEQSLLPAIAAMVREIDPGIVTYGGATMSERIHDSQSAYLHRSSAWLVGGFALVALLLSVVGLYGVVAYSVSQRTREIGVRMALGAQPSSVYRLILREAGWLTIVGILIGLGGAIGAATLMRGLLFGVQSWDVPTLATIALVLGFSTFPAGLIPAHRAASVNPIEALRSE